MNPEYEIIYTVNSSGGIATQVTPQGWTSYPKWSPDGKRIFFRWDGGKIAYVPSGGGVVDSIPIQSEFEYVTPLPPEAETMSLLMEKQLYSRVRGILIKMVKERWEVDIYHNS